MQIEYYRNIKTDEIVYKEEAEDYALTKLGMKENGELTIKPRGENGEFTLEQLENIEQTVEWYFSGNWILEEIEGTEEIDVFELINEGCELENV